MWDDDEVEGVQLGIGREFNCLKPLLEKTSATLGEWERKSSGGFEVCIQCNSQKSHHPPYELAVREGPGQEELPALHLAPDCESVQAQHAKLEGVGDGFGAIGSLQFLEDRFDMSLGGVLAYPKSHADVLV